jgi:hypothetical protein
MTSYCWVKNTYYLPWDKPIPKEPQEHTRQMVPYYQWIPFILLAQAVLFYLPSRVWHGLNSKAGVDADSILAAAHTFSRTDRVENRDRTLKMLVNQVDRFVDSRRAPTRCCGSCNPKDIVGCCGLCGRRAASYLLVLFLISKVFYIANVIAQLFILNDILGTKYSTFGFDIAKSVVEKHDWTEQSYVAFPRVTLCDFKVRGQDMANVHRYTVQCVLPINLYNESIYVFLWFWMVLVASVSILSFLVWLIRSVIPCDRVRFVRNHLSFTSNGSLLMTVPGGADVSTSVDQSFEGIKDKKYIEQFTSSYLKPDGVFLLRLIAHNTNGITTTEITRELWSLWYDREQSTSKPRHGDMTETASLNPLAGHSSTD